MSRGPVNKIKVLCNTCGTEFGIWPSRLKNGKTHYCSVECRTGEYNPSYKHIHINFNLSQEGK